MKLLKTICVVGLALCLTTIAYAGTQSVKISGDLTVRSIMRDDYGLGSPAEIDPARTGPQSASDMYFMSSTEVQIDADLTDNVSAVIRLGNQRDWNGAEKSISDTTTLATNGEGGLTYDEEEFMVAVDLAYIELKEFLYSPLTLRIGRQDLWFGKGFIVGANQLDRSGSITANEYTIFNAFDAVRATLDYDPWTVDVIAAKIYEGHVGSDDDIDLYGTNIGYIFDTYNAEAETYWFYKNDDRLESWNIDPNNTVHTIGLRGSADPIENWTVAAETAYQWGSFVGTRTQLETRDRSAWALDVSAECRYWRDSFEWKPVISAEYVYYSGDRHAQDVDVAAPNPGSLASIGGIYTGWDPMYRGKFDTAYREFIGRYYATLEFPARANYVQSFADASFTNQHQALLRASLQPTDSLTCDGVVGFFWLDEKISSVRTDEYVGTEFDVILSWDYTEDVTFGLLGAWFLPGDLYEDDDKIATDVVASVTLGF